MNHKHGFAAMAIAAVMLISVMGFAFTSSSAQNDYENGTLGANESASISMFTGDTFSYTPLTNLPSTIVASGNAMQSSGGFLTFTSGTLSGSPSSAGTYTATLTATWISGELQQQTTQTITFTVYNRISVTSASDAAALVGQSFSYSLTFTGNGDEVVSSPTITNSNGLTWNSVTRHVSGTPLSSGTTTFAWTISSPVSGNFVQFTLTVNAYDDLAITSPIYSEGYVGGSYSHTVTTSENATITASGVPGSSGLTWNSPTLSGTPNSSVGLSVSPYYKDHIITYTANAVIGGISTQVQQTHMMRIYASLEFTTLPSISNVEVDISGLTVQLSSDIIGATSILIDWGDGRTQAIDPGISGTSINETHEYENEGTYNVRILASNDFGTVQSIVMLSASGDGDNESADGSIFDSVKSFLTNYWYLLVIIILFLIYLNTRPSKDEQCNKNNGKGGSR